MHFVFITFTIKVDCGFEFFQKHLATVFTEFYRILQSRQSRMVRALFGAWAISFYYKHTHDTVKRDYRYLDTADSDMLTLCFHRFHVATSSHNYIYWWQLYISRSLGITLWGCLNASFKIQSRDTFLSRDTSRDSFVYLRT